MSCSLHCSKDHVALKLLYAKQMALTVPSSFLWHSIAPFVQEQEIYLRKFRWLQGGRWVWGEVWPADSSVHYRQPSAGAAEHCTFTASFHCRIYTVVTPLFLLLCLKVVPFVMYCAKLELASCCLLGAGRHETDLCNASLGLLCKDIGFGQMRKVRMNLIHL